MIKYSESYFKIFKANSVLVHAESSYLFCFKELQKKYSSGETVSQKAACPQIG
jgi:hypothetical protein